jgi:hypothetical protein
MLDEQCSTDSEAGRLLVDELVGHDGVDDAISRAEESLLFMGPLSVIVSPRAASRAGAGRRVPREQARCLAGEALVTNLERTCVGRRAST